jgi:hypothetical protein
MAEAVLSGRAVNRAFLARQLLLSRAQLGVPEAVEHLVGLQAQLPNPPYVGLWTRLAGFRADDLARMLLDREAVRIVLMRGTIHLVTAADCLFLRPVLAGFLERTLRTSTWGKGLVGVDYAELARAGRALVEERPLTFAELGALLADRWPDRDPGALANGVRNLVPLVQVPPRGVWGRSGVARHTSAESWLDRPLGTDADPAPVVLRYLAAFGPATVRDVQAWSGLTRLGEVVDRLRPSLRTFRDEHGTELFDLPDAPRPDPATPAPVRLLPEFDNALLSHADRGRIMADEHRKVLFSNANGQIPGAVLVDGKVVGMWKLTRAKKAAIVGVTPFARLTKRDVAAVTNEAVALLDFAAPGAETRDVRLG